VSYGNTVTNGRYLATSSSGPHLVGPYFSKSWNGADWSAPIYDVVEVGSLLKRRKRRVAMSQNMHNYSCTVLSTNDEIIDVTYGSQQFTMATGEWGSYWGSMPGSTLSNWTNEDTLELISKLSSKMNGSNFNLAVFLSQGGQALASIASATARVATAYRYALKGNLAKAAQSLGVSRPKLAKNRMLRADSQESAREAMQNNWLELQYGWRPLLGDVHDAAQMLAHQINVPFVSRHCVRKWGKPKAAYPTPHNSFMEVDTWSKGQYVAYVSAEGSLVDLSGFSSPDQVVWELLPYSFVLDWFLPVGNLLAAMAVSRSTKGQFCLTVTTCDRQKGLDYYQKSGNLVYAARSTNYLSKTVVSTRAVTSVLDVPLPSWQGLGGLTDHWQRCANALALIGQLRSRLA
jgi:hypothetical protein